MLTGSGFSLLGGEDVFGSVIDDWATYYGQRDSGATYSTHLDVSGSGYLLSLYNGNINTAFYRIKVDGVHIGQSLVGYPSVALRQYSMMYMGIRFESSLFVEASMTDRSSNGCYIMYILD